MPNVLTTDNPVGAAVANTVLDIYENEGLAQNAARVGRDLMGMLGDAVGDHPNVGEIRGKGLVCAVQLVENRDTRALFDPALKWPAKVVHAAYQRGLIVRPLPSVGSIAFSPPLITTKAQAEEMVGIFSDALHSSFGH